MYGAARAKDSNITYKITWHLTPLLLKPWDRQDGRSISSIRKEDIWDEERVDNHHKSRLTRLDAAFFSRDASTDKWAGFPSPSSQAMEIVRNRSRLTVIKRTI